MGAGANRGKGVTADGFGTFGDSFMLAVVVRGQLQLGHFYLVCVAVIIEPNVLSWIEKSMPWLRGGTTYLQDAHIGERTVLPRSVFGLWKHLPALRSERNLALLHGWMAGGEFNLDTLAAAADL